MTSFQQVPGVELTQGALAAAALAGLLQEMTQTLHRLTDAQYILRPEHTIPGTVGGHVRHALDHVRALVRAAATGTLDYDHRRRDTPEETQRPAALAAITQLLDQVRAITQTQWQRSVAMTIMVSADGPPLHVTSTLLREAAFVISHTIHHNAILGALVRVQGVALPEHFGVAPSTVQHQRQASCAPSR